MPKSNTSLMKERYILTVALILQSLFCLGQDDRYNSKTDKVEVDPKAYIDYSIIASQWEDLNQKVKEQDSIIKAKEATIQEIAQVAKKRLKTIEELTDIVVQKTKEVDDISDEQVETASGLMSKLRLSLELDTDPGYLNDARARARLTYDLKKLYILTTGTAGNNFQEVRLGVGYKVF